MVSSRIIFISTILSSSFLPKLETRKLHLKGPSGGSQGYHFLAVASEWFTFWQPHVPFPSFTRLRDRMSFFRTVLQGTAPICTFYFCSPFTRRHIRKYNSWPFSRRTGKTAWYLIWLCCPVNVSWILGSSSMNKLSFPTFCVGYSFLLIPGIYLHKYEYQHANAWKWGPNGAKYRVVKEN